MLRQMLLAGAGAAGLAGCASESMVGAEGLETTGGDSAMRQRFEARLSEDGTIPPNALLSAKAQRDAMIAAAPPGVADGPAFNWLGPGNIGGRIRAIIVHPTDPNVMWAGTASGGVWKTTNGGGQWLPLDDFLPSLAIGCMAIDPFNPDVLFAGTGEGFFETVEGTSNTAAIRGAGIFRTTDGGTTWSQLPSTANVNFYFVNRIAFPSGSNQIMLAATSAGIFRSMDAGGSWLQVAAVQCYDVRFHPTDPMKAVAGFHDSPPMYSLNGGVSWSVSTGMTASPHRSEVSYCAADPNIVYALVSGTNTNVVWRSTNGGQSYVQQQTTGTINSLVPYTSALWVDPLNCSHILAGGQAMYRSTNAGVSVATTYTAVHADHHAIVPHAQYNGTTNKTLFFGGDGGIYRTTDSAGSAATGLNNNLGVTQFYGAAVNPTSGIVIAGAQDNGTNRYSGDPQAWTKNVIGGDGAYCAADPTDPGFFYGESQRLAIRRSSNGGVSFGSSVNGGLTDAGSLNCNFIPFFTLDPNDPNRMLAAARRIWRSNNIKTGAPPTWSIIRPTIEMVEPLPPLVRDPPPDHYLENSPFNSSAIAVAQGNSDVIWVGYNNGHVARTSNGTAASPAWTRVDDNPGPLPNRWVGRIVIDPASHQRVYVSFMGYTNNNVWMTTDNGATWADISGGGVTGLPDVPVQALAAQPGVPGRLFAGTDLGLFLSDNFGQSWAPILPGVGTVPVDELVWKNNTELLVVTHGRGCFLGDVGVCYPDCNADGALTVQDFGCFQTKFVGGDMYADCNADGVLTVQDFGCFQTSFVAGCP